MKKLLKCMHCGNMVEMIEDKGVPVVCCGEKMKELVPNTTDAAQASHCIRCTGNQSGYPEKVPGCSWKA